MLHGVRMELPAPGTLAIHDKTAAGWRVVRKVQNGATNASGGLVISKTLHQKIAGDHRGKESHHVGSMTMFNKTINDCIQVLSYLSVALA